MENMNIFKTYFFKITDFFSKFGGIKKLRGFLPDPLSLRRGFLA